MDNEKIIKLKIKEQTACTKQDAMPKLQTNPIIGEMIKTNMLSEKMKFKFKDLFR